MPLALIRMTQQMWAWFPCGSYNEDQLSELWGVSPDEEGSTDNLVEKKHLTLPSLFQDAWSVNKLRFLIWELNWTLPPYNKTSIWICKRTHKHTNLENTNITGSYPEFCWCKCPQLCCHLLLFPLLSWIYCLSLSFFLVRLSLMAVHLLVLCLLEVC